VTATKPKLEDLPMNTYDDYLTDAELEQLYQELRQEREALERDLRDQWSWSNGRVVWSDDYPLL